MKLFKVIRKSVDADVATVIADDINEAIEKAKQLPEDDWEYEAQPVYEVEECEAEDVTTNDIEL